MLILRSIIYKYRYIVVHVYCVFYLKIKNNKSLKGISIHLVFGSFIFSFYIVIVQDLEINPKNFISARFPHKVIPPPNVHILHTTRVV